MRGQPGPGRAPEAADANRGPRSFWNQSRTPREYAHAFCRSCAATGRSKRPASSNPQQGRRARVLPEPWHPSRVRWTPARLTKIGWVVVGRAVQTQVPQIRHKVGDFSPVHALSLTKDVKLEKSKERLSGPLSP